MGWVMMLLYYKTFPTWGLVSNSCSHALGVQVTCSLTFLGAHQVLVSPTPWSGFGFIRWSLFFPQTSGYRVHILTIKPHQRLNSFSSTS